MLAAPQGRRRSDEQTIRPPGRKITTGQRDYRIGIGTFGRKRRRPAAVHQGNKWVPRGHGRNGTRLCVLHVLEGTNALGTNVV
jgi:hypothetical protein